VIRIGRNGLSRVKKTQGEFGIVREETHKTKIDMGEPWRVFKTPAIIKNIERYSNEGNLVFHLRIVSSLEDRNEELSLTTRTNFSDGPRLNFDLYHMASGNSYFSGTFNYTDEGWSIPYDLFIKINFMQAALHPDE